MQSGLISSILYLFICLYISVIILFTRPQSSPVQAAYKLWDIQERPTSAEPGKSVLFVFRLKYSIVFQARYHTLYATLKPGSHLCDKHNTSDISISISTCSFFLVLMLMLRSLVLRLSHKCEPGFRLQAQVFYVLGV